MFFRNMSNWVNKIIVSLVLEVFRFFSRIGGGFEVEVETQCEHSEKEFLYEAACSAGDLVCFYRCKICKKVIGSLEGLL